MLILGLDPGTAITGYGLITGNAGREKIVACGCFRTATGLPMPVRLTQLNQDLENLLDEYKPDVIAIEEIFYHKNAKTVISVAQARGVLMLTAARRGIPVAEYTPLQVKQAVVGYGRADKKQVQTMVKHILKLSALPKPDDAADALAIAICHLHARLLKHVTVYQH